MMVATMSSSVPNDTPEAKTPNKWKGQLKESLQRVQKQTHSSLTAQPDALEFIEELIFQLLRTLCQQGALHSVPDVEDRIQKTFPPPIDKWAMTDGQNALGKKKSSLQLPVDKIHPLLKDEFGYKVDNQVTLYITAVLEYIAADILKLTGNYVKNMKQSVINLQDIRIAMCADKVLMEMFYQDDDEELERREDEQFVPMVGLEQMKTEEIIKDLILEETQYLRDLNMIIKLFRDVFAELFGSSKDMENIFSNILDVQQLTSDLLSLLEDTVEATEENIVPMIGTCFEELAESVEFDIYFKFTEDRLNPSCRERLYSLLLREDLQKRCSEVAPGFKDVVKYILPKLLLWPIFHFLKYLEVLSALQTKDIDKDEQESLYNAYGLMHPLKTEIEKKLAVCAQKKMQSEITPLPLQRSRLDSQTVKQKMDEIQRSIDGWEGKDISQSCREYIYEGALFKMVRGRHSERYVFLFDGLLVITKQSMRRSSVSGPQLDYKFKEKYNLRRIEVEDLEDNGEIKNAFEIKVRDAPDIVFIAKTLDEKANWMAQLLWQLKRSMLDRELDTKLTENTKNQPLRLPSAEQYMFAEEDMIGENIVFEENVPQSPGAEGPLIKGGTLVKLVERLTYHMYADLKFVRTFLITYRTFSRPQELLALLIERFEIPDPHTENGTEDYIQTNSILTRDDVKRFRKEYAKPVQFRVLNVLRHWVNHHWYDFESNPDLQSALQDFLESIRDKAMKKWAETITKLIYRQNEQGLDAPKNITFTQEKPPIEWFIARRLEEFDLMTLHPIEIARQVTLLEFDLYRAVKPSEMVGSVWVKKQKNITSQNLMKIFNFSTRFTFWIEKCIIEAENFDERVAVMTRVLEILAVFVELNNFSGALEIVGALNSAPVHRLEWTFEEVRQKHHKLYKVFEEAKELNADHFKKYNEKLRSINPPCVPFLGTYLTTILLTEEGNPDFLPNRPEGIINFSKRRKVAEICAEIQQYQNQHYCLEIEPDIKTYFEGLDPFEERVEKDFTEYLFNKSLEIEPRNAKQPTKHDRKRDYGLKSPGIKTRGLSLTSLSSLSSLRSGATQSTSQQKLNDLDGVSICSRMTENCFERVDEESDDARTPTGDSRLCDEKKETKSPLCEKKEDRPPPLPERKNKRRDSSNENSPLSVPPTHRPTFSFDPSDRAFAAHQESCCPTAPPPLPPRTIPRQRPSRGSHEFNTLPRHFFREPPARPHTAGLFQDCTTETRITENITNHNGEENITPAVPPQLPPRTYRNIVHNRQQSS